MEKPSLKDLLDRYIVGNCSQEEKDWVEDWYVSQQNEHNLPISEQKFIDDVESIFKKLPAKDNSGFNMNKWVKVAAFFSGAVMFTSIFYFTQQENEKDRISTIMTHDITPVGNKARLRLSNGSLVVLDDLKTGEIYEHENIRFRKSENGQIEYLTSKLEGKAEEGIKGSIQQNEISTASGGQFQIVLPDGSKVWLNASSTLKYPNVFGAKERVVELSGEAFFEVKKQDSPFYVQTQAQRVEVVGTQFNVNAYDDEQIAKTTLIEGIVKVSMKQKGDKMQNITLAPGEQASISGSNVKIEQVDVSQIIAWKDGLFDFKGADLEMVMQEFSKWYGVDVKFNGELPTTKLWGQVYRNVNASQALKILEYYDLKFKIITESGISKIEIAEK